jgi:hypothetical protein
MCEAMGSIPNTVKKWVDPNLWEDFLKIVLKGILNCKYLFYTSKGLIVKTLSSKENFGIQVPDL